MYEKIESMLPDLVEEWEKSQDASFPERQKLNDFIIELLKQFRVRKMLDLGTGAGTLSKKILEVFSEGNVIGLDFDPIMLKLAVYNLSAYKHQFRTKKKDLLLSNWASDLPTDFDTVVSSLALHHLPDERRKKIYKDVYGLLKKSGVFLCVDEVASDIEPFDNFISNNLEKERVELVHQTRAKDWISFWNWVGDQCGVDEYALKLLEKTYPKGTDTKGDLIDQLDYLAEAGFSKPECFYRNHAIAVYGAIK